MPSPFISSRPRLGSVRRCAVVAIGLLVGLATLGGPTAPTEAAVTCVTQAVSKIDGGPFSGGTRLSWQLHDTCGRKGVTMKVNGQPAALAGSIQVDPGVTSSYTVEAYQGTKSLARSTKTALAGRIVGYGLTLPNGTPALIPVNNPKTASATAARAVGAKLVDSLGEASRRELLGKSVEIHLIPTTAKLTDLPPWQRLRNELTCRTTIDGKPNPSCVHPRPWSQVRGIGGELIAGSSARIALAVGEEEVRTVPNHPNTHALGHILAHELGHTVLDFAAESRRVADVEAAWATAVATPGHDFLGDDVYTASNADEYFAEGAAAFFDYEYGFSQASRNEYTRSWLAVNEPALHQALTRIYADN